MDKTCRILISIPGDNRAIDPGTVLGDLARKLRDISLQSGTHEILIFADGSVVVDAAMAWEPAKALPIVQQSKRKAG